MLTVLAPGESLCPAALEALNHQGNVHLDFFQAEGARLPGESRVGAIARARNQVRQQGSAHYAFFLDRDVVLPPLALEKLAFALALRRHHAALAANYQDEPPCHPAPHVAMGAVLWIRSLLEQITFRWEPGRCECRCACLDLRALGYEIDYLPGLRAYHSKLTPEEIHARFGPS